jgi:hypothetical protein
MTDTATPAERPNYMRLRPIQDTRYPGLPCPICPPGKFDAGVMIAIKTEAPYELYERRECPNCGIAAQWRISGYEAEAAWNDLVKAILASRPSPSEALPGEVERLLAGKMGNHPVQGRDGKRIIGWIVDDDAFQYLHDGLNALESIRAALRSRSPVGPAYDPENDFKEWWAKSNHSRAASEWKNLAYTAWRASRVWYGTRSPHDESRKRGEDGEW